MSRRAPRYNLARLNVGAERHLIELLNSMEGSKILVVQQELTNLIQVTSSLKALQDAGVQLPIYALPSCPKVDQEKPQTLVYLVRPHPAMTKTLADHANRFRASGVVPRIILAEIPRREHVVELELEKEGVYGMVEMRSLPINLVKIDDDLLSLYHKTFFQEYYVYGDMASFPAVAQSIVEVMELYGAIPHVHIVGDAAGHVRDLVNRLLSGSTPREASIFEHVIIIDRAVDLMRPMCAQLSYAGLLDETFGIKAGCCQLGEVAGHESDTLLLLDATFDQVWKAIRDVNFSQIYARIVDVLNSVVQSQNFALSAKSVADLRSAVDQLPELKTQKAALRKHINAGTHIKTQKNNDDFTRSLDAEYQLVNQGHIDDVCTGFVEELIARQVPLEVPLRLMCLMSLAGQGLDEKRYNLLRKTFLHGYGYEHMATFLTLEEAGLFYMRGQGAPMRTAADYSAMRKKLGLDATAAGEADPASQVYYGHTPAIAKIVETILSKPSSWESELKSPLKHCGRLEHGIWPCSNFRTDGETVPQGQTLIYVLGGVTYSEVASIRRAASATNRKVTVATTGTINSSEVLSACVFQTS